MDAISLLTQRNSAPRLSEPGPDQAQLERLFAAAARAPDHGRLRPWRFIVIRGEGRDRLGRLLEEALAAREPEAGEEARQKARNAPLRAPLVIAVVACVQDHPKIPAIEQWLSAGCAAYGILLAAQALGFGAIWRTGENSYDPHVLRGLSLADNEALAGFIYLGTPTGSEKPIPTVNLAELVSEWS